MRIKKCWILIVVICFLFAGSPSFAHGPDSRPSGWDKGEKRGWKSDVPPGLEKNRNRGIKDHDIENNGDEDSSDGDNDDETSEDNNKKRGKKKKK